MKTTQDDFYKFLRNSLFSRAENEDELGYKDPFVTKEQKRFLSNERIFVTLRVQSQAQQNM